MPTRSQSRAWLALAVLVSPSLVGCGGAPGTNPDDMSAAEHREAAEAHDRETEEHEVQYDPRAVDVRQSYSTVVADVVDETYNPTGVHAVAAANHAEIAGEHRRAARALEAFEEGECAAFSPNIRQLCPLLGQLAAVENVDDGVRLEFREGVNTDAARAHVACHIAFARTQGREGMDHCPMYVEGARVEHDDAGGTVLLTDRRTAVDTLRRRAAAHVHPNP